MFHGPDLRFWGGEKEEPFSRDAPFSLRLLFYPPFTVLIDQQTQFRQLLLLLSLLGIPTRPSSMCFFVLQIETTMNLWHNINWKQVFLDVPSHGSVPNFHNKMH